MQSDEAPSIHILGLSSPICVTGSILYFFWAGAWQRDVPAFHTTNSILKPENNFVTAGSILLFSQFLRGSKTTEETGPGQS